MQNIKVVEACEKHFQQVADLVTELLIELEPCAAEKWHNMRLDQLTLSLLKSSKISAFLAMHEDTTIGVITLHECAAIYAGGVFGEISELYVKPEYRSSRIGDLLLNAAIDKGRELGWKRLEVGSPPANESPRTIQFYENRGFECTGARLRCLIE